MEKKSEISEQIEILENKRIEDDVKADKVSTDKLTRELVELYIESFKCEVSEIKNVVWRGERVREIMLFFL